jgi:hypothetical protein
MNIKNARRDAEIKSKLASCWIVFEGVDSQTGKEFVVIDALRTDFVSPENLVELWVGGKLTYQSKLWR